MKIAFFGSPIIAKNVLEKLHQKFPVSLVVTQPDKPVGRKQMLTATAVKQFADQENIPVITDSSMVRTIELIKKEKIALAIVVAYGLILPKKLLEQPKFGFLNIHFSLLPKYRGAAPIQYAILNGDEETGTTIVKMDEKLDRGPIVAQEKVKIAQNDDSQTLGEKLTRISVDLLLKSLSKIKEDGKIYSKEQDHSKATYTRRLTKDDGFIPFSTLQKVLNDQPMQFDEFPAFVKKEIKNNNLTMKQFNNEAMHNFIRALYPWPAVWTTLPSGKRLKILKSKLEGSNLVLTKVQLEGKTPAIDLKIIRNLLVQ